ncbi:MAG TPA: hypothetical protein VG056_07500 [Pirellulales bacterium]|nr:hypothetical protein [Pirellulales bacterium]
MPTRDEFLRLVWDQLINAPMRTAWIDGFIIQSKTRPHDPLADTGQALERLLATGADRRDLSLVVRAAIYEAVFGLLYMLGDPGVGDGGVFMLHESLLSADPSGREGRPGSAP